VAKSIFTLSAKTGVAIAYVRTLNFFAPVLVPIFGADRVLEWAKRGAFRLVLWRIDNGPWRRLR